MQTELEMRQISKNRNIFSISSMNECGTLLNTKANLIGKRPRQQIGITRPKDSAQMCTEKLNDGLTQV